MLLEEEERKKLRNFIFEEFMKKDPELISFNKPDSGSGVSEDEESSSNFEEEEYSDEED